MPLHAKRLLPTSTVKLQLEPALGPWLWVWCGVYRPIVDACREFEVRVVTEDPSRASPFQGTRMLEPWGTTPERLTPSTPFWTRGGELHAAFDHRMVQRWLVPILRLVCLIMGGHWSSLAIEDGIDGRPPSSHVTSFSHFCRNLSRSQSLGKCGKSSAWNATRFLLVGHCEVDYNHPNRDRYAIYGFVRIQTKGFGSHNPLGALAF